MTELLLIRHGESVRNHASDLARHGDPSLLREQLADDPDESGWPLTHRGVLQAQVAGEWLRASIDRFDLGFVSPFRRTLETAAELKLPVEWVVDDRLRERLWGEYPAGSYSTEAYLRDLEHCGEFSWRSSFPGGESIADLVPEATSFRDEILEKHRGKTIAVVTHGGTLGALQLVIEGLPPAAAGLLRSRHLGNCCVIHYQLFKDRGQVRFVHPSSPEAGDVDWHEFRPGCPSAIIEGGDANRQNV